MFTMIHHREARWVSPEKILKMKTIVAATDMSVKSRPALRFALRLALAMNARLKIVHVHYVMRASTWADRVYQSYQSRAIEQLSNELNGFVKDVEQDVKLKPEMMDLAIFHHLNTVDGILEYAERNGADYICVGTHGAGLFSRLIGSNTARLIGQSTIPVLSIPATYRQHDFSNVVYATDMTNVDAELHQVVEFAKELQANIDLLHLYYAYEPVPDVEITQQTFAKRTGYKVQVHYVPRDPESSVLDNIDAAMGKLRPSVLAMFIDQDRDFVDRLLSSSITREYTYFTKVPLLSFAKKGTARNEVDYSSQQLLSNQENKQ